jgi:hypothetical protein
MTTLQQIRIVGNTFIAQPGIEQLKIKKTFKNGGGILGGCLNAGDKVKIIAGVNDIDTISFQTDVTLHRLSESYFYSEKFFKKA